MCATFLFFVLYYIPLYFDCISLHAYIQSHLLVALQHM